MLRDTARKSRIIPVASSAAIAAVVSLTLAGCGPSPVSTAMPSSAPPSAPAVSASAPPSAASATSASGRPNTVDLMGEVDWKKWRGVLLPFTDLYGPSNVSGDIATGFTNNAQGALLAMMQHQMRLSVVPDKEWPQVARAVAVVAPGSDTPPTHRVSAGLAGTNGTPYYAGYRWVSYTPKLAVADMAIQEPNLTLRTSRVTVAWVKGDWKIVLPVKGMPAAAKLGALDGYQPWPEVPH